MTIGYLAQVFPSISETFVYREVKTLREAGFDVETFSTWKPSPELLSADAKGLVSETFYIFPLNKLQFLKSHFKYFFGRPQRYLSTLAFFLSREHASLKNRFRTFLHFCEAVHLARAVEEQGIKHLHVHFALNACTMAMVVSKLTGTTYSFTAHANDIFVNPIMLPEKIELARFIIAISDYNIRFLNRVSPDHATAKKMHLVHCGIDIDHFSPPDHRPEMDVPFIFSVGRLIEKKGFHYLIKACRVLVDRGYQFKCMIAGPSGAHEQTLVDLIETLNLSDYVTLMGVVYQEDLKDYLSKEGIFVLPCVVAADQDMDGIPNSLMEAMAMEMPVISTNVSGIPEMIKDHKTGLLVPPEDEEALADAMAKLIEDSSLRHSLGSAGRQMIINEFEIKKNVKSLLAIFEENLKDTQPTVGVKV